MRLPEHIIYTIYMQEPLGSERASDPLELQLLMVMKHDMGAGN